MSEENHCPQCGAALPAQSPQGLCPGCLLKWGLESQTGGKEGGSQPGAADRPPPTPEEIAAYFPDLEILELVGRGGMGVVYKARQKRLDRLVALKILAPKIGQDPAFAERFAREARAMAMLSHPHVVAVHDFGQTDGLYYFLMEFVDGVNLRRLLDTGKLTPEEALAIVPQICEALQYAHDHGVVHRDIKPENLLLDKEGRVKIADFGIAKLVGREANDLTLTGAGQIMGTLQYMAPEQIEHPLQVDHRADIYSLGVVFYQMLTGELPIGRFAPPSKKVQIDVRLDEVVLRALEKEPERRYQQASEIKTQVESIVTTPPEQGRSDTRVPDNGVRPVENVRQGVPDLRDPAIEQARRQVKGPAIGLLVTGILNWMILIFLVVPIVMESIGTSQPQPPISELAHAPHPSVAPTVPGDQLVTMVPAIAILAILIVSSLVIFAALKMKRLQAYGLAIAASILAIIISPGNLIGLPIGIWALVVLSQREVRAAFAQYRARATGTPAAGGGGEGAFNAPYAAMPRLSKTALTGAIWAGPFFLIIVLALCGITLWMTMSVTFLLSSLSPILILLLATPIGVPILGYVALKQIRHSAGRLYGLGLALFDLLAFPLLVFHAGMAGLGIFAVRASTGGLGGVIALLFFIVACVVVDFLIVRWFWRAVSQPPAGALPVDQPWRAEPTPMLSVAASVLMFCLGVFGLAFLLWSWTDRIESARARIHTRIFEADAKLVDELVPGLTRKPGQLQVGMATDRHTPQTAEVSADVFAKLLADGANPPGLLEYQVREGSWWPKQAISSHYFRRGKVAGDGNVDGFLAIWWHNDVRQLRSEFNVLHGMNSEILGATFVWEGSAPPPKAAQAFFIPFSRTDGTARYLIIALEVSDGTENEEGISKVHTEQHKATIEARLDPQQELRVFVGQESLGWSAAWPTAKTVTATVEASSQIRMEDGSFGKGFVYRADGITHYVAITPDGPVPFGEFIVRDANKIARKDGVFSLADIHTPDGKLVPVSVMVRPAPKDDKRAHANVAWGDWNTGWSVRLRANKTVWGPRELPEFTIDLRKRDKGEPDVVQQSLHNWLLQVNEQRFRLALFSTSREHKQVFEPGTTRENFITFHFHRDEHGLHIRTGANRGWTNSYSLDPVGKDGQVLSHPKPSDQLRLTPGQHVVRIAFPMMHNPPAAYTESDLAHFAFSNPVVVQIEEEPSAEEGKDAIASLKLGSAERQLKAIQARYTAGMVTPDKLYEAELARDLAAAEAKGDTAGAARAKLHYAKQMLAWIEPQYKAGYRATPQDYEKAKLARDVAAAELQKLEQAQHVKAGSTATGGNTATTIQATGTIEPCEVADVVAQIAGQIVSLGDDPRGKTDPSYKGKTIDYGSPVEEGTVLARIDDAVYKTRVGLEKAKCERAEAELAAARAKAKEKAADPATIAAEAAVAQAKATLKEAEINLARTAIRSPINGVVVARRINVGQNVAPEPNAPSLFLVAKTANMQLWASVNNDDIHRIHDGMKVTFSVDAHPKDVFTGKASQIRLNATRTMNVIGGTVVVDFDDPAHKLLPYMEARVQFPLGAETAPGHAGEPLLQFAPVIERVVNHSGKDCLIDLDSGTLFTDSPEAHGSNTNAALEWAEKNGIDAGGSVDGAHPGLIGFDMVVVPVANERWNSTNLGSWQNIFLSTKPGNPVFFTATTLPTTFIFKTREGGMGILQVVGFTDDPKGVNIRYKLAQKSPQKEMAIPSSTDREDKETVKPKGPVLTYEVDPSSAVGDVPAPEMDKLLKVIDLRLNAGAERRAQVRKVNDGRIEVALMRQNSEDKQRVERLLARPGTLEFRMLASSHQDKAVIDQAEKEREKAEIRDASGKRLAWWVPVKAGEERNFANPDIVRRTKKQDNREITEILVVTDPYNVTGEYLTKAEVQPDRNGRPCIGFALNDAGGELFAKLTGDHLPDKSTGFTYKLGIILDGDLWSAPSIQSTIHNKGQISGSFTNEQASEIADVLNAGSLPVRLRLVKPRPEKSADAPSASERVGTNEIQTGSQPTTTRAKPSDASSHKLMLRLEKGGKLSVDGKAFSGDPMAILQRIRDDATLEVIVEADEGVSEDDVQRLQQLVNSAEKQRDPRNRQLWEQISQRQDANLRKEALAKLQTMLTSDRNADRAQAVRTLQKVQDVPFDRAPLLPLVRKLIADEHQSAMTRAVGAVQLANLGGGREDIPVVATMANDRDSFVRKAVAPALYNLDPKGEHPLIAPAIEKLLSDESAGAGGVVHHTIKALWGRPVSPAAERRLIELSNQPGPYPSSGIAYDAVYYALSTRPVVSRPVAERLVKLALSPDAQSLTGRAIWGLSHHPASKDARELVVDALVRIFDDTLDASLRQDCIFGLGLQGGPKAIKKLETIATSDENVKLREQAKAALKRVPADGP